MYVWNFIALKFTKFLLLPGNFYSLHQNTVSKKSGFNFCAFRARVILDLFQAGKNDLMLEKARGVQKDSSRLKTRHADKFAVTLSFKSLFKIPIKAQWFDLTHFLFAVFLLDVLSKLLQASKRSP